MTMHDVQADGYSDQEKRCPMSIRAAKEPSLPGQVEMRDPDGLHLVAPERNSPSLRSRSEITSEHHRDISLRQVGEASEGEQLSEEEQLSDEAESLWPLMQGIIRNGLSATLGKEILPACAHHWSRVRWPCCRTRI